MYDAAVVAEPEQRALVEHHALGAKRRTTPAVYVVDDDFRILYSRSDPTERRAECRFGGEALPALIEQTVRRLCGQRAGMSPKPDTLVSAPNASVMVRVVWLEGGAPAMAVLVERFRVRDYFNAAQARFTLTPRETEVLRLVVAGLKNGEIAARLHISESTAVFHVKRLLFKMHARNRTELVSRFFE